MAFYTMTIQELLSEGFEIFDFDYTSTVLDKKHLEERFINEYYLREICFETFSIWKLYFKRDWVNKIKHYDKLFQVHEMSTELNPLTIGKRIYNEEMTRRAEEQGNETTTGSSSSTTNDTEKLKDTPISAYDGSDYVSAISNRDGSGTNESEVENIRNVLNEILQSRNLSRENIGNIADIKKFYDNYIDVIDVFIRSFNDLFMGVF